MSRHLTRLSGFLVSIAIDAIVAYDLITRPDKSPVIVIGDVISLDAVLFGVAVLATGTAIAFAWPAIVWLRDIPRRKRERDQERETGELNTVIALLQTVRDEERELWLADGGVRAAQVRAQVLVARAKLREMGLGLPEDNQNDPDNHWPFHAAELIPYISGFGIDAARRQIAKSYENEV